MELVSAEETSAGRRCGQGPERVKGVGQGDMEREVSKGQQNQSSLNVGDLALSSFHAGQKILGNDFF